MMRYAKANGGADRWIVTEAGWSTFTGKGEREFELPENVRGGCLFDLMGNRSDLGDRTKLLLTETPVYVVGR